MKNKIPVEITSDYSVENVMIVEWHKNAGDMVAAGEALCFIDMGKADGDLPAPASGLLEIVSPSGDMLEGKGKRHIIAYIETDA